MIHLSWVLLLKFWDLAANDLWQDPCMQGGPIACLIVHLQA
jgi:hypothetical protein